MKVPRNLGMTLLAVWLILSGILPFLNIHFASMGLVLAVLAVVAGVLILMGR